MTGVAALALLLTSWPTAAQTPEFPCFTQHGRFSTQNGIARTIWLIGTKRLVAVENEFPPPLEKQLEPYLRLDSPRHSYIYGDFEMCPTSPDVPGQMRQVRLVKAEKLVIQNLEGGKPAFKLGATWPKHRNNR